jgi:hypothetical protein
MYAFIELKLSLDLALYFVTKTQNQQKKTTSTPVHTKVWLYVAQWFLITCQFASTSTSGRQSIFFRGANKIGRISI